jgi:hypothetical protein
MASTQEQTKTIGASELAQQIGAEPTELRKFLRSESKNVGRGKRYEFTTKQASAVKRRWKAAQKAAA